MRAMCGVPVLLLALGAVAADDTPAKYEAKEQKFRVAFPAKAEVQTKDQDSGGAKIKMFTVSPDKDRVFMVMAMAFPPAVKDVPTDTLLDAMEKGAVDKSGAKLLSSKKTTFGADKLPARDVSFEKDGNKLRALLIRADARVYMVMCGGPKDFITEKPAVAFFDSFELLK